MAFSLDVLHSDRSKCPSPIKISPTRYKLARRLFLTSILYSASRIRSSYWSTISTASFAVFRFPPQSNERCFKMARLFATIDMHDDIRSLFLLKEREIDFGKAQPPTTLAYFPSHSLISSPITIKLGYPIDGIFYCDRTSSMKVIDAPTSISPFLPFKGLASRHYCDDFALERRYISPYFLSEGKAWLSRRLEIIVPDSIDPPLYDASLPSFLSMKPPRP